MSDEKTATQVAAVASVAAKKMKVQSIVVCGVSRLPENIAAKHMYGFLNIELEVDPFSAHIIDVSSTLVPTLGHKMLCNALIGFEIEEGIKNAIVSMEQRFFSITKRAIIAALEDAYRVYRSR